MVDIILTTFVVSGVLLALIAFHSCWMLAGRSKLTWLYPVMVIIVTIVAINGVIEIQGYPVDGRPEVKVEYVGHALDGDIAILIAKHKGEVRTYKFKPTQEEKDAMKASGDQQAKGKKTRLTLDEGAKPEMELIRMDRESPKE